jgi:hypothetical protein
MPSKFQEILKTHRENKETARAGIKWDDGEDTQMLDMIKEGKTHEEVAKVLYRTPGSIKTRLVITALKQMEDDKITLEEASQNVCIDPSDVSSYVERKEQRLRKRQVENNRNRQTPNIFALFDTVKALQQRVETLENSLLNR